MPQGMVIQGVDGKPIERPKDPGSSVLMTPLEKLTHWLGQALGVYSPEASGVPAIAGVGEISNGPMGKVLQKLSTRLAETRIKNPIKAYHGSPHDFNQFDTSKINTGEGAQAYGHGLYFAENPQVAYDYAQKLSQRGTEFNEDILKDYFAPGRIVKSTAGWDKVLEFYPSTPNSSWGVKVIEVKPNGESIPVKSPRFHATAPDRVDVKAVLHPEQTGLYEVNLHVTPDELLNWDKSVDSGLQQKLGWKPTLRFPDDSSAGYKWNSPQAQGYLGSEILHSPTETLKGQAVHYGLLNEVNPNFEDTPAKLSAQRLRDLGFKGIQYLDQGSRSQGIGTRNFSIFDDSIIELLKKYGILAPLFGSQLGQQHETPPSPSTIIK